MAKTSSVGGAATLSSSRVQKAFSINFRENKRLFVQIKLIENEHIRNIRHVKQDIKETRIWLDAIRISTGESQHGLRSEVEQKPNGKKKKKRKVKKRSKPAEPEPKPTPADEDGPLMDPYSDMSADEDDHTTKYSEQDPVTRVRFQGDKTDHKEIAVRPSTDITSQDTQKDNQIHRPKLKSEPAIPVDSSKQYLSTNDGPEKQVTGVEKNRVPSANSARSSLASLTAYQRRHKLQSMMVKKQNPLEFKRLMISRDTQRVNEKVTRYLNNLENLMDIPMPDLSVWRADHESHNTPFAKDVNVTS